MVNDELSMIMPGTRFEVLGFFLRPTCTRQTSPPSVEGLLPFPPLMEEKGVGDRGQSPPQGSPAMTPATF